MKHSPPPSLPPTPAPRLSNTPSHPPEPLLRPCDTSRLVRRLSERRMTRIPGASPRPGHPGRWWHGVDALVAWTGRWWHVVDAAWALVAALSRASAAGGRPDQGRHASGAGGRCKALNQSQPVIAGRRLSSRTGPWHALPARCCAVWAEASVSSWDPPASLHPSVTDPARDPRRLAWAETGPRHLLGLSRRRPQGDWRLGASSVMAG
jgi:hypothetical protein